MSNGGGGQVDWNLVAQLSNGNATEFNSYIAAHRLLGMMVHNMHGKWVNMWVSDDLLPDYGAGDEYRLGYARFEEVWKWDSSFDKLGVYQQVTREMPTIWDRYDHYFSGRLAPLPDPYTEYPSVPTSPPVHEPVISPTPVVSPILDLPQYSDIALQNMERLKIAFMNYDWATVTKMFNNFVTYGDLTWDQRNMYWRNSLILYFGDGKLYTSPKYVSFEADFNAEKYYRANQGSSVVTDPYDVVNVSQSRSQYQHRHQHTTHQDNQYQSLDHDK